MGTAQTNETSFITTVVKWFLGIKIECFSSVRLLICEHCFPNLGLIYKQSQQQGSTRVSPYYYEPVTSVLISKLISVGFSVT